MAARVEAQLTVADAVRSRIAAHCGVPIAQLSIDTDLFDDLGLESLDAVELMTVVEEELNIDLNLDTLTGIETVGDLIAVVGSVIGRDAPGMQGIPHLHTNAAVGGETAVPRRARGSAPEPRAAVEVEFGLVGYPYLSSRTYIGRSVEAEDLGVNAVWFRDCEPFGPHLLADPTIAAAATILGSRRIRVGILDLQVGRRDFATVERACATLAELGGGRFVLGTSADGAFVRGAEFDRFYAEICAGPNSNGHLVVQGASTAAAELAIALGASWLVGWREAPIDRFRILAARINAAPGACAGIVVTDTINESLGRGPGTVAAEIEPYLEAGARRVVIDPYHESDPGPSSRAAYDRAVATIRILRRWVEGETR